MGLQDEIRSDLATELFAVIGKSVTLKSKSTPVYNNRGEEESQTFTNSNIIIIPYNLVDGRQSFEPFGDLQEGETDAAVPYTVTIKVDDIIVMEGDNWVVKDVSFNYLPDNVVTIIRMVKEQS